MRRDRLPRSLAEIRTARPADEWDEDDGPALWWAFPVAAPPYAGTPLDEDFPDYVTHWTPIALPITPGEPADPEPLEVDAVETDSAEYWRSLFRLIREDLRAIPILRAPSARSLEERNDARDIFFSTLATLADAKDVAANGPKEPGHRRSLHAVTLTMGEILRAKGQCEEIDYALVDESDLAAIRRAPVPHIPDRLSAKEGDPDYFLPYYKGVSVFVDGEKVSGAIEADRVKGYVLARDRDGNGKRIVRREGLVQFRFREVPE